MVHNVNCSRRKQLTDVGLQLCSSGKVTVALQSSFINWQTLGKQIKTHKCNFCTTALSIHPGKMSRNVTSRLRLTSESARHLFLELHNNYTHKRNRFIRRTYAKESTIFNT